MLLISILFLHLVLRADNCTPMTIGTSKEIIGKTEYGANDRKYRIQRQSESRYEVSFNLKFADPKTASNFRSCFASGYLLKTTSGKEIRIMPSPLAPEIEIKIQKGPISKRNEWQSNMSCSLMAHELLHSAGLCDEYKYNLHQSAAYSNQKGSHKIFGCRRVRENNLMGLISAETESVLLEDQFNQIILPGCALNSDYTLCAEQAYKSNECVRPAKCLDTILNSSTSTKKIPITRSKDTNSAK